MARVAIGMSGGVDSSVAAALLVQQGFDVVGVTLNVWPALDAEAALHRDDACCSLGAAEDARRVADILGIPHYTLNFRDVFEEKVVQNFVDEYRRGRTPNPCIRCNQHIKFSSVLERIAGLDADYVATGHYARVGFDPERQRYVLRKGIDPRKDQSYVLYPLEQDMLRRVLFPLGELTKDQTRALATELGLPVAGKAESQEICFVPDNDYAQFLLCRAPSLSAPGPIIDSGGQVIGEHRGIAFYTVGQRRGLGLGARQPLYVVQIDAKTNTITVGPEAMLYSDGLIAEDVNWVSVSEPDVPLSIAAKVRYRAPTAPAVVTPLSDNRAEVRFSQPQKALTPGQAAVFYDGDVVLGGGTIASVARRGRR